MALFRSIIIAVGVASAAAGRMMMIRSTDTTIMTRRQRRQQARNLQTSADACFEENDVLVEAGNLGNMNTDNHYSDGLFFFFNTEEGRTDYDQYYTVDDGFLWNYTDLRDLMAPLCEFYGGKMYSVTGAANCSFDEGVFTDVNYPMCLGPSCEVQPYLDVFEDLEDCVVVANYTAEALPYILSESCRQETRDLFNLGGGEFQDGLGSGNYIFSGQIDYLAYCNVTTSGNVTTEDCDFADLYEQIQAVCEDAGGYLYSYDDMFVLETTSDDGTATTTNNLKGAPICVGRSCDTNTLFTDVLFPAYNYGLNYEYTDTVENATEVATYTPLGFQAISEIIAQETESPTVSPTQRPTLSPTQFPTKPSETTTNAPTLSPQDAPTDSPDDSGAPTVEPTTSAGSRSKVKVVVLAVVSLVVGSTFY